MSLSLNCSLTSCPLKSECLTLSLPPQEAAPTTLIPESALCCKRKPPGSNKVRTPSFGYTPKVLSTYFGAALGDTLHLSPSESLNPVCTHFTEGM